MALVGRGLCQGSVGTGRQSRGCKPWEGAVLGTRGSKKGGWAGCGWCRRPQQPVPADMVVEDTRELCSCPTPCNLTRYGKEISMVRIPNKGSARYLARKYNRNETYIR